MRAVLRILFGILVAPPYLLCNRDPEPNVNSRYTVESVEISPRAEPRLSSSLRTDLRKLVGGQYDPRQVERLAGLMSRELPGYRVLHRIAKGTRPEALKVVFDVVRARRDQDVVLPRLAYHSKQNLTFGADLSLERGGHTFSGGMLTDNNELLERYSGIRGAYQRFLANGRVRPGLSAGTWRAQWDSAVESALAAQPAGEVPGIYRSRVFVEPDVRIEILPGVWVDAGLSFQRIETQFPAARHESSHALTSSLRLERRWETSGLRQTVEAGYRLRAATRSLGGDFAYTRHALSAAYRIGSGREQLEASLLAGVLNGRAPLFDRFVLGNANTLRGWNKFDVAPLGGSRMAHGSLDWRHKPIRVIYDTGVLYDRGGRTRLFHSLAAGLTTGRQRESFSFLVAFPLRDGRVEPIFLLGMNF